MSFLKQEVERTKFDEEEEKDNEQLK